MRRLLLALLLTACTDTHGLGPDGSTEPFDAGPPPLGPPPPPATQLDMLFMVDNGGGVTEEQANLTAELPRLVDMLTTGDFDQDGVAEREPFTSVHFGVVTGDMGTGGFTVPTCLDSSFGDDGVLRRLGRTDIPGCQAEYPAFLGFPGDGAGDELAHDTACVATTGSGGCGFEQQLEATLKALSPSGPTTWTADGYAPPRFFQNSSGHGDGLNAGFARDDSLLAVVLLTEEEDCSASDPELFNTTSATYTDYLSLRCFTYADSALHPVERYIDGFTQLRRDPRRLVFFPIVGIPLDLQPEPGEAVDYGPLISDDPDIRDERMQVTIDPAEPTRLQPSCNEPGTGLAFPPVRIVQVARGLRLRQVRSSVASICNDSLHGAMTQLALLLRP